MEQNAKNISNHKSVGTRLFLIIAVFLTVVFGIKIVIDSIRSYGNEIKQKREIILEETQKNARFTEQLFQKVDSYSKSVQIVLEHELGKPINERSRENILKIMEDFVEKNGQFYGLGVYFEPNAFDGKDREFMTPENKTGRFVPWANITESGDIAIDYMTEEIVDTSQNSWYTLPFENDREMVLDPYIYQDVKLVISQDP